MSEFTNHSASAEAGAARYIPAVLELLGDQDPMLVLAGTADWCRSQIAELGPDQLAAPEAEGKWSIAGVLAHFADSELVWGYRLRRVLAEDRPVLSGFDQDQWADRLGYRNADVRAALALFDALRTAHLRLLESATSDDLERVAIHAERGEESARHMVRLYAGHDLAHRRQLERIVRLQRFAS